MQDISRRGVLVGACALFIVGSSALPAAADSAIRRLANGKLEVTLKKVPELAIIGGAVSIGAVSGNPIGLARTGESTYRAFSLRCPHQGVPVTRSSSGWNCPAHGSQFEADGDLVMGPATRGLAPIPVSVRRGRAVVG